MSTEQDPLTGLRAEIDTINEHLVELLARRFEIVSQIAVLKRRSGVGVRDAARELEMLEHLAASWSTLPVAHACPWPLVEPVFKELFQASAEFQSLPHP